MSETYARPVLASYRDTVTELMRTGEPFGEVEDAIDELVDLNEDAKAALWLLAFSLRDQGEQARAARAYVAAVA
jgi:cytochrome c-type biogenesis protein CcmH/NrfG